MPTAREITDTATDAFLRGDVETIAGHYAADAVLVAPEGTFRGREQIVEYWRAFVEAFSDFDITITCKLETDDTAMDEWTFSATHTGPFDTPDGGTLAATGTRITTRGVDVGVVRDGRIAEHHLYYDQVEFLSQLGLLPAPA